MPVSAFRHRVLLWGDSLTEGRPGASFVKYLKKRMPHIRFENFGRRGDTAASLLRRLEAQTPPADDSRASLAVLWVGTNDVYAGTTPRHTLWKTARGQPPAQSVEEFDIYYRGITEQLKKHAEKLLLLPPLFVGENPHSECIRRVREISGPIEAIAGESPCMHFLNLGAALPLPPAGERPFAPQNMLANLVDALAPNSEGYHRRASARRKLQWTYDGIHLNRAGAEKVAEALAGALGRILE